MDALRGAVVHVFFPKKLPDSEQQNLAQIHGLLLNVVRNEAALLDEQLEGTFPITVKMLEQWTLIERTSLNFEEVSANINNLEDGDMMALYISQQNAGLLISSTSKKISQQEHSLTASVFQASCDSKSIMSVEGDLCADFPENSVFIPKTQLLNSTTFAKLLENLSNYIVPMAQPESQKAGHTMKETRDVCDPMFITDWMLPLLCDDLSQTDQSFPRIRKKIRDDVVLGNVAVPFRRSGFWMTLKVALQIGLVREMRGDIKQGTFLYKAVMLLSMVQMLEAFHLSADNVGNWDLKVQMMAKIARRLEKLKIFASKLKDETINHQLLTQKIAQTVETKLHQIQLQIKAEWLSCNRSDSSLDIIQPDLGMLSNNCNELQTWITSRKMEKQSVKQENTLPPLPSCDRKIDPHTFPRLFLISSLQSHEKDFQLREFENWTRHHLDNFHRFNNSAYIKALFCDYTKLALLQYKNDPVANSRLILTVLQSVMVLDKIATRVHPLLLCYPSGVELQFLERLVLPGKYEMVWAMELKQYFLKRNSDTSLVSLISEKAPNANSFAVKFAKNNTDMKALLTKILNDIEEEIKQKFLELDAARQECANLRSRISTQSCKYYYNRYTERQEHDSGCIKCYLKKQLDYKLKSVRPYGKPLPDSSVEQNAIVFEMKIPQEIASLRDMLFFFQTDVLYHPTLGVDDSSEIRRYWTDYSDLSSYHDQNYSAQNIKLASTVKTTLETHYSQTEFNLDYTSNEGYILNNGMNLLYRGFSILSDRSSLKTRCTFSIPPGSKYTNMQWFVDWTDHNTNQVLATQCKCPAEIRLCEYVEFGSLRAGHLLQYHNIVKALSNGNLSLTAEEVFALLAQAQWQNGPTSNNDASNKWVGDKDNHVSLQDSIFATELLRIVEELVDANAKKWSDPYTLSCLISIACRVLELGDVKEQAARVLRKCRTNASNWIDTIGDLIEKSFNAPEPDRNALKSKLVLASLTASLTFNVSPDLVEYVMSRKEDLLHWLKAISNLYNEVFWNFPGRCEVLKVTNIQKTLIRLAVNSSVSLESAIAKLVATTDSLSCFAKSSWCSVQKCSSEWERCISPHHQVFQCLNVLASDGSSHVIYVDVLFGRFLVDGFPIARLPENIVHNKKYQRVFQNADLRVQPSKAGSFTVFTTTATFHDCSYSFYIDDRGELVIRETSGKSKSTLELVPHELFSNFPISFMDSHSHWWHKDDALIKFRKKNFEESGFSDTAFYELRLDTFRLLEINTGRLLISMQSNACKVLTKYLQHIEPLEYIHCWTPDLNGMLTAEVELTRLELKFFTTMDDYNQLNSHEYPSMRVARNQNIGTFVGLQNKLVLDVECDTYQEIPQRKVIVPNSSISVHDNIDGGHHQLVTIDLKTVTNHHPRFFVYDLDDRLKCLRGGRNQSAWIYLAALHGATAVPLPDPLTGLTGTEMAFEILQSSGVWSSCPYDLESLRILRQIADFSPKRVFYPEHLTCQQRIHWPSGLSPTNAHEGYQIIVDKLIQDSNQLSQLFPNSEEEEQKQRNDTKREASKQLENRHYWRHQRFQNTLCSISNNFYKNFHSTMPENVFHTRTSLLSDPETRSQAIRQIGYLCHTWTSHLPVDNTSLLKSVRKLLVQSDELNGYTSHPYSILNDSTSVETIIEDCVHLRSHWIDLFSVALEVGRNAALRPNWALLLSTLAFIKENLEHLLILHAVAVHWDFFNHIDLPKFSNYFSPSDRFTRAKVVYILNQNYREFDGDGYQTYRQQEEAREKFNRSRIEEVTRITDHVINNWTPRTMPKINLPYYCSYINHGVAEVALNVVIFRWHQNVLLEEFIDEFETVLQRIILQPLKPFPILQPLEKLRDAELVIRAVPVFQLLPVIQQMEISKIIFHETENVYKQIKSSSGHVDYEAEHFQDISALQKSLNSTKSKSSHYWTVLERCFRNTQFNSAALEAGGLFPRITPRTMLPLLLLDSSHNVKLRHLQNVIGAICVYWTLEQKYIRCIQYKQAGPLMEVAFQREEETVGLKPYRPNENPSWLLLELEMNMTIRPMQAEVARAMLNPSNGKNSVLQLNMGEGKTSLIVPMLITSIADGSQLCRLTVIKSIFETNFNLLRHTLGGLLNRRVFTIPCRRDMELNMSIAQSIQHSYDQCKEKGGVVVTLPEYRLSFQLKGYEFARNEKTELAAKCISIQRWLNEYARDLLDESDDILSVKYQLIYTVGDQLYIDGGALRWEISQSLLKLLPFHLRVLQQQLGNTVIEIQKDEQENRSIFSHCRLLKPEAAYDLLISRLADDFLDGKVIGFSEMTDSNKVLVKKILVDNSINSTEIETLFSLDMLHKSARNKQILLIMAGYLRFGILEAALGKRWRVNYGVNVKGHRKMAVPFKAKDVASERTEFGHPDMGIVLTQLSYYYSGLTDDQLTQCFKYLETNNNIDPVEVYSRWIQHIPPDLLDASITNYKGLNLDDYEQRTKHLFPVLRKAMSVIDFWLSLFVFPKESKQFEGKMTTTAWDLVSENQKRLTTGFSGTNDSSNTLPVTIAQNDIAQLQDTNVKLEEILMRPENKYQFFEVGISSKQILSKLKENGIKVLLDCGALMLELSNQQVAEEWLKIDSTLQGVVFFDKKNTLTVLTIHKQLCPLELSPFRERLDGCGVYLDDEHTRGTDLKFPRHSRAAVTLGSGLTRDKTVQACMRMRMLGRGHFVTFCASHEAHNKIMALSGLEFTPSGAEVLKWVKFNSKKFEEDGMVYWAVAGANYCRKRGAELIFNSAGDTDAFLDLGKDCTEDEVLELLQMYGHARNKILFSKIFQKWFNTALMSLKERPRPRAISTSISRQLNIMFQVVEEKCRVRIVKLIPKQQHFSQLLDEEQEKELEFELEEEPEKQLPGPATPCTPKLSQAVKIAAHCGILPADFKSVRLFGIAEAFKNTHVWKIVQENCWGSQVLVSQDFIDTVKPHSADDKLTGFLRPPTWIIKLGKSPSVLLISPFEANGLFSLFKQKLFCSTLHMYSPRTLLGQEILINNAALCIPSSNNPFETDCWSTILPPLSVFAGNLYFETENEQQKVSEFLGLIPRPRDEKFKAAFDSEYISPQNGFVPVEFRDLFDCPIGDNAFHLDPEKLVTEIARIRNEARFPLHSHVAQLVVDGKKSLL